MTRLALLTIFLAPLALGGGALTSAPYGAAERMQTQQISEATHNEIRSVSVFVDDVRSIARTDPADAVKAGPKNCGECETIGGNHRFNGGFDGWFCRLLEEQSQDLATLVAPQLEFTFAVRARVVRDDGRDCYKCEGGDGCHSVLNVGTCDSWHPYCPVGAGDALASLALRNAIEARETNTVSKLIADRPELFHFNAKRGLVQVLDCRGLVMEQFALRDSFRQLLSIRSGATGFDVASVNDWLPGDD